MRTPTFLLALMGLSGLLLASTPAGAKPPVFTSRVPVEPLRQKLTESGGDPAKILHPTKAADLDQLESGKRYKFVVLTSGKLAIAPLPADAPQNEYVHPILADGAAVRTAGGIRIDREGTKLQSVTLDQDSKAYCPTAASLDAAKAALKALRVPAALVRVDDRPPACSPQ